MGKLGTLNKLLQPSFVIRLAHPYVARFARRGPIVAYICTEIFVDVGIALFYFFLHNVTIMVRMWYVWYLIAAGIRILCSSIGLYAVWTRSLQVVRLYFLLFLLSVILVGWSWKPILRLRCFCDNFRDCQALKSFETSDMPFVNRETPMDDKMARLVRSYIRVADTPSRTSPETVESFTARSGASLLQEAAAARSNSTRRSVAARSSLAQASQAASGGSRASARELRQRHTRSEARSAAGGGASASGGKMKEAALRIRSWWRTRSMWASADGSDGADGRPATESPFVDSFFFGPDGVSWENGAFGESDKRDCQTSGYVGTPIETLELRAKLEEARRATWVEHRINVDVAHPSIAALLRQCFDELDCRSISIRLKHMGASGAAELELCKEVGNFRVVDGVESGDLHDTAFGVTLRRKSMEVKALQPIYSLNLQTRDTTEGMNTLSEAFSSACVCEAEDELNCRRDQGGHSASYWCYVAKKDVEQCILSGTEIFWEAKTGKYWSSDLCSPPECHCSGLGMMPPTDETVKSGSLWNNKLNYGATCDTWNDDGRRWCFTGFDSICADRGARHTYQDTDPQWSSLPLQFWSQIPCIIEEDQERALEAAQLKCSIARAFFHTVIVLHLMLRALMIFVMHIFIQNRCTDRVEVEEQFAISWSDDDDDDWMGDQPSKKNPAGAEKAAAAKDGGAAALHFDDDDED